MTLGQKIVFKILNAFGNVVRHKGFPGVTSMGNAMGKLMWRLLPSRRKLAIESIMKHLGKSRAEAERIALEASATMAVPSSKSCLRAPSGWILPTYASTRPNSLKN